MSLSTPSVHNPQNENKKKKVPSAESVSEGHPDKICDRISDEIVDLIYTESANHGALEKTRVACETLVTTNKVVIAGEFRSSAGDFGPNGKYNTRVEEVVRNAVKDIGYDQDNFHWEKLEFFNFLHGQSVDIAQGVDEGNGLHKEEGAGDQGHMFGGAVNETPELMPAPIHYSHKILEVLADARHNGDLQGILGPDSKSQLTVKYDKNGKPFGVSSIVLSTQHLEEDLSSADIRKLVEPYIRDVLPEGWIANDTEWHVNPTGKFVIGGPDGDAGLTGRKIIVDTYGGAFSHGGGAFSGKDFTKVDRSAAYMARYAAKNIVASGAAERCEIQLSYAIGVAAPQSVFVETYGTNKVPESDIEKAVLEIFDLTPKGIRTTLDLVKPIYTPTSAYGHFGRAAREDGCFSWERTNKVKDLQTALKFTP